MADSQISNRSDMVKEDHEEHVKNEERKKDNKKENKEEHKEGHNEEDEEEDEEEDVEGNEKGDEEESDAGNAMASNVVNYQSSYDPAGPYDMYDSDGNIVQMRLDDPERNPYYKDLTDFETEEELHRAIFHGGGVEMINEDNDVEVSNRYSQWLSTRREDGVIVPRPLYEMEDLPVEMCNFAYRECEKKGRFCCLMHENLIRERCNEDCPARLFYADSKGPAYS